MNASIAFSFILIAALGGTCWFLINRVENLERRQRLLIARLQAFGVPLHDLLDREES